MVLGAGDTSEKTARSLMSRGAKGIIVSNRSHEKAVALASELKGEAVEFEKWSTVFDRVDIVISSTSAPGYVLDAARLEPLMKARRNRPLLLIDIAVPRDIDPVVNFVPDVFLYNIDDLTTIADDYLKQRQSEIARCEQIIRERAAGLIGRKGGPQMASSHRPALGMSND
jgi:glutamyl-tRNA reductase